MTHLAFCETIFLLFGSFTCELENRIDCYFCTNKTRIEAIEKLIFIMNSRRHNTPGHDTITDSYNYAVCM